MHTTEIAREGDQAHTVLENGATPGIPGGLAVESSLPVEGVDTGASLLAAFSDAMIVNSLAQEQAQIAEMTEDFERIVAPLRERVALYEAEVKARILAAGGTAMAHPGYEVILEVRTAIDKRIDVLRRLFEFVPADELRKGIFQSPPPKPEDMPWQANATHLKPLGKKYGGDVARILEEGLVHVEVGTPKLVIRPKQKRVGPAALSGAA